MKIDTEIKIDLKERAELLEKEGGVRERIAVGCDHAAFERKHELIKSLTEWGFEVVDCGAYSTESVDYPDVAEIACRRVTSGDCSRALLICGTGIGMSIAANKIPGIRCALCCESYSARLTRLHNDSNVLSMGARTLGVELAKDILHAWLFTQYPAEERNARRIKKISIIEKRHSE